MPALHIIVSAVRLKLWVLTPTNPTRSQAAFRILSALNRVKWEVTPRTPGNNAPGLSLRYSASSWLSPGWISTTRVLSLPLVVDFLKVKVSPLMSVVWSAKASDMRHPVNKQMPNKARSRGEVNLSLNNCLSSSEVRIFPCPLPATFVGAHLCHLTRLHEMNLCLVWN